MARKTSEMLKCKIYQSKYSDVSDTIWAEANRKYSTGVLGNINVKLKTISLISDALLL